MQYLSDTARSLAAGLVVLGRLLWMLALPAVSLAQPAPPLVVETDPLPPEEQRAKFHLPEGCEIQLVASEPDIGKPMNMNFDARGRLWVTSSVEYPYPVAGEGVQPREAQWGVPEDRTARDWVTVLTGIDTTGRPQAIHRFAENLNIPIGVIPEDDGAIIYSIPHIERFRDTDGDGRADERTKLYGPFGNVDTHGMVSSLSRGLDGWIYACHGFRNTSAAQGTDGHRIEMNSGNTFRFRPDGSRIEQWTHGQVNPFGLTFDPWGDLYSADCHSRPLTCLLRGAYYQSFGKPHDGLGFGPDMINHSHGSTGICGPAWYDADQFPPEYRDCIYLCNPVTGRVHRDRIAWRGASPWAEEQPDFITCDDGWFRPVDVQLGPDGALYIADFYNALIGHYEVPLTHPRRDRTKGRIWRVVWRGGSSVQSPVSSALPSPATAVARSAPAQFDLTQLTLTKLLDRLGDANLTVRQLATQQIINRFPPEQSYRAIVDRVFSPNTPAVSDQQQVHALWIIARQGKLQEFADARHWDAATPLVLTHLVRALAEEPRWTGGTLRRVVAASTHNAPRVQRAAFEALALHPFAASLSIVPAFDQFVRGESPERDAHLNHVFRMALRNQLRDPDNLQRAIQAAGQSPDRWARLALGDRSSGGAAVLMATLRNPQGVSLRKDAVRHIARYGEEPQLNQLIEVLSAAPPIHWREELLDVQAVHQGLQERGGGRSDRLQAWAARLAKSWLAEQVPTALGWTPRAHGPNARAESVFSTQTRRFADGAADGALLHSSHPLGEERTGILRSDPFELPEKFRFFIAGHNGFPDQPVTPRNFIRLCDAANGETLRETLPPRNDTAQLVEWDLSDLRGRSGYIEIVDGDNRSAYAWLAVGRFSIEGLNPVVDAPQQAACELAASLKLTGLETELATLIRTPSVPMSYRHSAAEAWLALHPDARRSVLREAVAEGQLTSSLREDCFAAIVQREANLPALLKLVLQATPAEVQLRLATLLAGDREGAALLLDLVQQGAASPRLLQDAALVQRLRTWNLEEFDARLSRLTASLPAPDAALAELLTARRDHFRQSPTPLDLPKGQALFKQHCAACHQLGGEGAKIGPQLDGVGVRGPDRLLEDILDPHRNVDAAFRTMVLVLEDGRALTGLFRREEGATLVLADSQGKEFSVSAAEVEARQDSPLSLMPAQLAEKLPPDDLNQLVRFLLEFQPKSE